MDEINRAGFKVNVAKTRMQCCASRQLVTGLSVNKKVNTRAEYYRAARAMSNSLFSKGSYFRGALPPIAATASLEGILNHIYFVKDGEDHRASAEKKKQPTAAQKLYKQFLFYKNFVNLERPLLVCEGKTDNVYLMAAIRRLSKFHSNLLTIAPPVSFKISFFKYTSIVHRVLQLGGGTGDLKYFIKDYSKMIKGFKLAPLKHPVIILIDNDDGAKEVFSVIKEVTKKVITHTSADPFYLICHNLYLVKTPECGSTGVSWIENCFDAAVLGAKVDGKTFNPSNDGVGSAEYGKVVFAEKVIRPNAAVIDFSKFEGLIERVVAVIDDYKVVSPGPVTGAMSAAAASS